MGDTELSSEAGSEGAFARSGRGSKGDRGGTAEDSGWTLVRRAGETKNPAETRL